jgi:HEAT repeat protein
LPSDDPTAVHELVYQLHDRRTFGPAPASTRAAVATALAAHPGVPHAAAALAELLCDRDGDVREAATAALAAIFGDRPDAVLEIADDKLRESARRPLYDAIQRSLCRVDSAEALHALLLVLEGSPDPDDSTWLLDRVAATARFSNELLVARLAEEEGRDPERAGFLAEILDRRGVDAGHAYLLRDAHRSYIDQLVARGPYGIRALCRLSPEVGLNGMDYVAERLAAQRAKTEATVREIAADLEAPGALTAVTTLGYWDSPEHVDSLLAIARDRRCPRDVREAAIEALCRLEAPEAIETLCVAMADAGVTDTTRWACATALGAIGNVAALPALEVTARGATDGTLRQAARDAILAIRWPDPER